MNKRIKSFQYGNYTCTLETGRIARQASGAVLVRMGDTVLLVTAMGKKEIAEGQKFFPLTVNYQEKNYAVGSIPGGYFKREGRPTEKETLTSRLIDRPLRPLFPEGFYNEVQVIATLMSLDPHVPAEVPALIGASAALSISGIPFRGPLAAARVGYIQDQYVLNPSRSQLDNSRLNLMVAGTKAAILMVESEADQLPEEVMLEAVLFGHDQLQVAVQAIEEFAEEVGVVRWDWQPPSRDLILANQIREIGKSKLVAAYQISEKLKRLERIGEIYNEVMEQLVKNRKDQDEVEINAEQVSAMVHELEKEIVREQILSGQRRIDGRGTEEIRDIITEVGILPRTHGSSLFTRGETQAMVVCTLGTERDAQMIDALEGEYRDSFMLHYNFLPFCVGETGMMVGPKRREIGHGKLAKRALQAVMPSLDEFPYVLRIVSEITESNGSSSMASVCGASMALMDAGVPIKSAVAGIAMGLIKDETKYAVLSDILGDEDHLGDMDFKVAGTEQGVTALQMDIKIDGITKDIMETALEQAKRGRLYILNKMMNAIKLPRQDISQHAPRIITLKINPDKIRDVIGKGGVTIRELTEQTNSTIDISDDGIVKIAAVNGEDGAEALRRIEAITAEVEIGKSYEGKVIKIVDFGAFVEVLPGRQGLVHISQIANERVNAVTDYLKEGQLVRVKVTEIDRQGRVRLTMRDVGA